jgi:hypothetical protein
MVSYQGFVLGRLRDDGIELAMINSGSSRLCVIILAYGILKCLLGKTFRTILRIFYQYRPRFHTETRRAQFRDRKGVSPRNPFSTHAKGGIHNQFLITGFSISH